MATMPPGMGLGGPPGPAPNPLMMALMQRLAAQSQGGGMPGGPPGAQSNPGLEIAQNLAQIPYGKEQADLRKMRQELAGMVPRFLQRQPKVSSHLVDMYQKIDDILELIDEIPAEPLAAPPPGMPTLGGPAMIPPMEASPYV